MRIVVAGGTGTVGVPVVAEVQRRGHDVVVVARASGVDVLTGSGLDDALAGADAVIDVLGTFTLSGRASARFSARVVGIRVPTPGWHRIASGVLAGGGDVDRGTLTFRDWLAAQDLPADA